jgi:dihydroflavonol-4-reductase
MLILVTGGTGFVGSHTTRVLLSAGHEVRLMARDPAKVQRVFSDASRGLGIARGDMTDAEAVARALSGCDAVVHSAALVAMEPKRAHEMLVSNLRGVQLLIGGALERGIERVVHVSSVGALLTPGGPVVTADSPVTPGQGAYTRSKSECDAYVRGLQDQGARIRISYPSGVIGPDDPGLSETNHALAMMTRGGVVITTSGLQLVDARDLAPAHLRMLELEPGSGRYIVGGHFLRWSELADALERVTGQKVRRVAVPAPVLRFVGRMFDAVARLRPHGLPVSSETMALLTQWPGADSTAAEQALGIRFRPVDGTLSDTLRWLNAAGHLDQAHVGAAAAAISS